MKMFLSGILLLLGLISSAQEERGKLLLFKVDIKRDLKIEKEQFAYLVLEMNEHGSLKNDGNSLRAFFDGFTDANIVSCVEKDSLRLVSFYKGDTFEHDKKFREEYSDSLKKLDREMNYFMTLNIKSNIYAEKITISYILIDAHYCKGLLAKPDSKMMGIDNKVILIIDDLVIDGEYRIRKENMLTIIKALDYNSFIY